MKLVYVASPHSKVPANWKAFTIAKEACLKVKQEGYTPISPVLAFSGVYTEEKREEVMDACACLLCKCDLIYVAPSPFTEKSEGIKQELKWAKELGIERLRLELFE